MAWNIDGGFWIDITDLLSIRFVKKRANDVPVQNTVTILEYADSS